MSEPKQTAIMDTKQLLSYIKAIGASLTYNEHDPAVTYAEIVRSLKVKE